MRRPRAQRAPSFRAWSCTQIPLRDRRAPGSTGRGSGHRGLLPASGTRIGQSGVPRYTVDFPPFGFGEGADVIVRAPDRSQPADRATTRAALDEGPYRRSWELAQRLRDQAETQEGEQVPMLNVFVRDGDQLRHSWATELMFAPRDEGVESRHVDSIWPIWSVLDMTPEGRGTESDFPKLSYE